MTPMPSLTASSANASPMRTFRSSDSTTHGPAMRNGLLSTANRWDISVGELGQLARRRGAQLELAAVERPTDEAPEKGGGGHRPRLELGGGLGSREPRMIGALHQSD